MKMNFKNIFIIFLMITVVAFGLFAIPERQHVEAVSLGDVLGGVGGAALFCSGIIDKVGGFITGLFGSLLFGEVPVADNTQNSKEGCLDHLAFLTANILIEEMTRQTVNWINGQSDGEPKFVTNVGGFLGDVADKAIGEFLLHEVPLVCSPFRLEVRANLVESFRPERNFQCTLSEAISNVEDFTGFVDGNFFKGGWEGWLSLSRPENNVRGATLAARNSIDARVVGRQNIELTKLEFGQGFISWEQCPSDATEHCPAEVDGGEFRPSDQCGISERICVSSVNINGANVSVPVQKEIRTPGTVIESQLNNVLTVGQERLLVADEINEIVSTLLNRLLSEVLTNPTGLLGFNSDDHSGSECAADPSLPQCSPDDGNDLCQLYGICGGGGPEGPPAPFGTIFFASNGAEFCDEDQNDEFGLLTDGETVQFNINIDNGATFFIIPHSELGVQRCQEYGNFGNNPPFSPTMTFTAADQGSLFEIPPSSSGSYTLGSYGGVGGANEAFLLALSSGGGGDGGGDGGGNGGGDGSEGPKVKPNFNSSIFINNISNISDERASLNFRSKLKMERGGAAWWDAGGQVLHVRWEEVPAWVEVLDSSGGLSFGQLHIVAYVQSRGGWYDWNIEDLQRNKENGATNDVRVGSSGLADWVEVVAFEENSPDEGFRLENGDWFGLYIAGYPKGSDVRSDILPVKYSDKGGSAVGKQNKDEDEIPES